MPTSISVRSPAQAQSNLGLALIVALPLVALAVAILTAMYAPAPLGGDFAISGWSLF
jgi:hypothetical protein